MRSHEENLHFVDEDIYNLVKGHAIQKRLHKRVVLSAVCGAR